jgi:hypothetical protein
MDYSGILTRAWNIVWNNKFMILLGILVVLGGGGGGNTNTSNYNFSNGDNPFRNLSPNSPNFPFDSRPFQQLGQQAGLIWAIVSIAVCIGLLIALVLMFLARIADGGLVYSANTAEGGGTTTLGQAWGAAWEKATTLVGIGIVGALPGLIFLILYIAAFFALGGMKLFGDLINNSRSFDDPSVLFGRFMPMIVAFCAISCPAFLVGVAMRLLVMLADRAAMLENKDMVEAFGRGWEILTTNIGQVLLLGLIQIGMGIGIGIVLAVPAFIMTICCILLPLLWVVGGAIQAYFSTVWTLAWRQWAGGDAVGTVTMQSS